jgi:hypothetical protein
LKMIVKCSEERIINLLVNKYSMIDYLIIWMEWFISEINLWKNKWHIVCCASHVKSSPLFQEYIHVCKLENPLLNHTSLKEIENVHFI